MTLIEAVQISIVAEIILPFLKLLLPGKISALKRLMRYWGIFICFFSGENNQVSLHLLRHEGRCHRDACLFSFPKKVKFIVEKQKRSHHYIEGFDVTLFLCDVFAS